MTETIEGTIPVMITRLTENGALDYAGLERLINGILPRARMHCCRLPLQRDVAT